MDYNKIKKEIKEISDISTSVPQNLQEKCFEVLLNNLLENFTKKEFNLEDTKTIKEDPTSTAQIPFQAKARVFMQRHKIQEEDINKILCYIDDDIHFIKDPPIGKIAVAQINWALLLSLKKALPFSSLNDFFNPGKDSGTKAYAGISPIFIFSTKLFLSIAYARAFLIFLFFIILLLK